jgi:maltose O-acetyltransferase
MNGDAPQSLLDEARDLVHFLVADERPGLVKFQRAMGVLRAKVIFRNVTKGAYTNATGHVDVVAEGRITLGDQVQFFGGMIPSRFVCQRGGELFIDSFTGFNYGVSVECARSIRIGKRCMFGSMVVLRDAARGKVGEVIIEDDVWVAHGAIIEPGVRVSAGSVISAGSVVVADVPPNSLALGNPARSVGLALVSSNRHQHP